MHTLTDATAHQILSKRLLDLSVHDSHDMIDQRKSMHVGSNRYPVALYLSLMEGYPKCHPVLAGKSVQLKIR